MKAIYTRTIWALLLLPAVFYSCKKVDQQLDAINAETGVYDANSTAFAGDTITISGKFNNAADLQFFFDETEARIVAKGTAEVPKTGNVFGEAAKGNITVETYKVIVPAGLKKWSSITARFNGNRMAVIEFMLREPLPLIPGNVVVSTFAGKYSINGPEIRDDSLAKAGFGLIESMIVQPDGTIYTADLDPSLYQFFIRKVANGVVKTIAGGGTDIEGPGLSVDLGTIKGMAVDNHGDVLLSQRAYDFNSGWEVSRILKLDKTTHQISIYAGRVLDLTDSTYLNDGDRLTATFGAIGDISFDAAGNLYVADEGNTTIRVINTNGKVTSPIGAIDCQDQGGGVKFCYMLFGNEDGFGREVRLMMPQQIAAAANGRVYFTEGNIMKEFNPTSLEVARIAGGPDNTLAKYGPINTTVFTQLSSVAADATGNLLVVDGNSVLKIDLVQRFVYVLAGGGIRGHRDGPGEQAEFAYPTEVGFDAKGDFYVADRQNGLIRKISVKQ